jgi:hypothetical protein
MKKVFAILIFALFFWAPRAQAQDNFSVGAALTSTFSGIGIGVDVGAGDRSQSTRFGLWLNVPSPLLQTTGFGVGGKVVLISYGSFDLFGLPLGGYGDLIALYGGLYGSLGFGGNTSFFVGAGAVLGIEVNPIPQVFGFYAEFGLGLGVPSIVDANLSVGVRIFVGKLF